MRKLDVWSMHKLNFAKDFSRSTLNTKTPAHCGRFSFLGGL